MAEVLTQMTSTTPDYGIKTGPMPDVLITRPIPEGVRTWMPALVVLLGMPLMALVVTKYALIPPMKRAVVAQSAAWSAKTAAEEGTGALFYARISLNTFGSDGAHAGLRGLALLGADSAFKGKIDHNRAKLTALAAAELKDTTVSDLDMPGVLAAKRAQLLADFNRALGESVIQDVYIAEYPPR